MEVNQNKVIMVLISMPTYARISQHKNCLRLTMWPSYITLSHYKTPIKKKKIITRPKDSVYLSESYLSVSLDKNFNLFLHEKINILFLICTFFIIN